MEETYSFIVPSLCVRFDLAMRATLKAHTFVAPFLPVRFATTDIFIPPLQAAEEMLIALEGEREFPYTLYAGNTLIEEGTVPDIFVVPLTGYVAFKLCMPGGCIFFNVEYDEKERFPLAIELFAKDGLSMTDMDIGWGGTPLVEEFSKEAVLKKSEGEWCILKGEVIK